MGGLCTPSLLPFAGLEVRRMHLRNERTDKLGEVGSAELRSEERHGGQTPNMTGHHVKLDGRNNIPCAGKCASDNQRWHRQWRIGDPWALTLSRHR